MGLIKYYSLTVTIISQYTYSIHGRKLIIHRFHK